MKKIAALIVAAVIFIFIPLSVCAVSLTGVCETAWFPEPPDVDNVSYLVLDDGNGDSQGYSGFIFTFVFPGITKDYFDSGEVVAEIQLLEDGQQLVLYAPTLAGVHFFVYVYRLNGQELNVYNFTIPDVNNTPFIYKFTFASSYRYYWAKGFIPAYQYGSAVYKPAIIYWLPDYSYQAQLKDALTYLRSIQLHTISIDNNFSSYFNLFEAYYRRNHEDLNNISSQLHDIYELLGGGETVETFPDNSEMESNVDDYISEEHSYLDQYDDGLSEFNNQIDEAESYLSDFGNGFAAVKMIFENFVLGMPLAYIIILFSLVFGVVVLILGKRSG